LLFESGGTWNQYIASNILIEYKLVKKEQDWDLLDYYLKNIEVICDMGENQRKTISDNENPDYESRSAEIKELVNKLSATPDYGMGSAKAAQRFLQCKDTARAAEYFYKTLKDGNTDITPATDAAYIAIKLGNKEMGLLAANSLKDHYELSCHNLMTIGNVYRAFGFKSEATDYKKKFDKCARQAAKKKKS
jgi:hypothetical protein